MIIRYHIPFSTNRKVARTYCKIKQFIKSPFAKRKMLKHLDGDTINYQDIPVIINNFNRIIYLEKLIGWLEKAGMRHIFIIDNASSYPPLLDYYQKTNHTVIKLDANIGYKALWDTDIHLWFKGLPYIYTDPDILPVDECPLDAVRYFQQLLNQHQEINKVGFGLQIHDIPDFYPKKTEVLTWEKKFWDTPVSENLYKADIDTTFALYRESSVKQQWGKTLRTGGKYVAQHLPWYENPVIVTEEERFYRQNAVGSVWYS